MSSAFRDVSGGMFLGQQGLQPGAHFEGAVGLSYAFD